MWRCPTARTRNNEEKRARPPDKARSRRTDLSRCATQVRGLAASTPARASTVAFRHSPATSTREPPDRFRRSARGNATAAVTRIAAPAKAARTSSPQARGAGVALPSLQDQLLHTPLPGDSAGTRRRRVSLAPFIHACKNLGGASCSFSAGVFASQSRWCLTAWPLEQLLRPGPELRPSHFSYALRASGHVLRPAPRLAPRGPTPKSRFLCAGGR